MESSRMVSWVRNRNKTATWEADTTIPGQSEPGSNGNEGVLQTPKISGTGTSLSDAV